MFVDIEAGPDQAYIWLISVLVEGMLDSLRLFYAKTPASEKDILNDFLSYHKEFNSYVICHYGGFDERLTRRQMTTYRLNYSGLGRWFDLQDSIKKSGILSFGSSSSLKHVAGYFGYVFRQQDMDGTSAPRMYVQNICKQDGTIAKKFWSMGRATYKHCSA